jgi:hypothetical protein
LAPDLAVVPALAREALRCSAPDLSSFELSSFELGEAAAVRLAAGVWELGKFAPALPPVKRLARANSGKSTSYETTFGYPAKSRPDGTVIGIIIPLVS